MFVIHIAPSGEAKNPEVLRQFRIVNEHFGSLSPSTGSGDVSSALTIVNSSSATTQTLPSAASSLGRSFAIKNRGNGLVTVSPQGSETIDGKTAAHLNKNQAITVVSDGTNWVVTAFLSASYA